MTNGLKGDTRAVSLQRWLSAHLPRADDVIVHSIDIPGNGASNITGLVDTEWTTADGDVRHENLVLRTVSPSADQLYEHYDLAKQYRIMECLAPTEIEVPRLLAFEPDPTLLGREFYVMYDTGGQSVPERPSYHESGWFADLTDEEQRSVWMQGIDAIGAIHRLDWERLGLGFVAIPGPGDVNQRFVARHSDLLHWMERRNDKSYPRLRRIYGWLEEHFPRDTPSSMLWADAKLGNLMVDHAEIVGVLDWEHCTAGPCLYDLANWMIFDRLMGEGAGYRRLPGLPSRAETIERYEAASGHSGDAVEYFELFSAVRLANVIYGVAPGLIAAGLVPDDFEESNSAAHVMDAQLEAMGLSF